VHTGTHDDRRCVTHDDTFETFSTEGIVMNEEISQKIRSPVVQQLGRLRRFSYAHSTIQKHGSQVFSNLINLKFVIKKE
jgi:hypothetical protein